jgi:hypothetical protein
MPFEIKRIESISEALDAAHKAVAAADSGQQQPQVLFLCDIDNTILRMPGHLGSDEWYRQQLALVKADAAFKEGRVAVDLDHLRAMLDVIYAETVPVPHEGDLTADALHELLAMGGSVRVCFVTARNATSEASTRTHLGQVLGVSDEVHSFDLIMCSGGEKSRRVAAHFGDGLDGFAEVIFVDDCFANISDMALRLPVAPHQRLTLLYFPHSVAEDRDDRTA